jgi:nicotinate-nucleotide adenylyltransferase
MTIGLFGGSFDPIHHGHLIVAQVLLETLRLEQLRFIPAREQPFKHGRHAAPVEHRLAMLRLAVAGVDRFAVETVEVERPGPSYTVDTLRALRAREPEAEFTLLIGADAAASFHRWHEAAAIPALARVVAFSRDGVLPAEAEFVREVVEVPALGISATDIRQRVRAGQPIRYWVPGPVAEYISAHQLYLDVE